MEPLPILPPNIWPGPIPSTNDPDYESYRELVVAWFADDQQLQEIYSEENDVTLRSLAYSCVTRGSDAMSGHKVEIPIAATANDGQWETHADGFYPFSNTQVGWGWYSVYAATEGIQLPPSEDLPAITLAGSDETSFSPSEPILTAQHFGEHQVHSFFLFENVAIPKSAKVNYAYVRLVAANDPSISGKVTAFIGAQDSTNPSAPTNHAAATILAANLTNDRKAWTVEENDWWADETYYTDNIACVIQTIVDKPGWQSGRNLQLVFMGDGTGTGTLHYLQAKSRDDGTAVAPTLVVYYDTSYSETMTGGVIVQVVDRVVKLGGAAVVTKRFSTSSTGGVRLNGAAPNSNSREIDERMSGGVSVSGSNTNLKLSRITAAGGAKLNGVSEPVIYVSGMTVGGSADVWMIYDATRLEDEWDVFAVAGKNIPRQSHGYWGRCYFKWNGSRLFYSLIQTAPTTTWITVRGPAGTYETTETSVTIPGPYINPFSGTIDFDINTLRSGRAYVQFSGGHSFRSQLLLPGILGGQADVSASAETFAPQGGVSLGGTCRLNTVRTIRMSLGVRLGGTADVQTTLVMPRRDRAGVKLNGRCGTSAIFEYVDLKAGARIGGRVTSFFTFIYKVDATGGAMCDTTNTYSHYLAVALDGSLVVGGATVGDRIYWPRPLGGLKIDGLLRLNFIDQVDGRAGIRLGGKTPLAYEKFFESVRNGYCRAMASENICTTPPPRTDLLITSDISPILEDYLPTLESAGWCEATERCSLGILPKIVKNRQGQYLPPKEPVRRRATSLTQRSTTRMS